MASALLRGVISLLVQVCGDFAGTLWACAAALRATVVIVRSCAGLLPRITWRCGGILAREYDWGMPLLWLAQRVLCLPASEADSERAGGQMRGALGDYAPQMADDTLRRCVQMAMSQTLQGAAG
jgi:hypothetical protein